MPSIAVSQYDHMYFCNIRWEETHKITLEIMVETEASPRWKEDSYYKEYQAHTAKFRDLLTR